MSEVFFGKANSTLNVQPSQENASLLGQAQRSSRLDSQGMGMTTTITIGTITIMMMKASKAHTSYGG